MGQKKQGKNKNLLIEEIYKFFTANPGQIYNYKQVAAALQINDGGQRQLVNVMLEELVNKELLISMERGKYRLKSKSKQVIGRVQLTTSGAYVICEDLDADIYISEKNLLTALDGDLVQVQLFSQRKSRDNYEGEIVDIVERFKINFVGNVQLSKGFAFVVPDNAKIPVDFFIKPQFINGAQDGDKVVVKLVEWTPKTPNPQGEIIKILGKPGDNDTEIHAILEEYGLPYEFPEEVVSASEKLNVEASAEEIKKRRDFREILTFTIDPFDAKDFDDALSFKRLADNRYEIGIHIADVSHYVKPNSIIDKEAVNRATSVYLVDRVVPMLPEVLSNQLCSLRPNEDKLCFSAVFEMDDDANVLKEWFGRTIIHSDRRFTYEEAQEIIETGKGDHCEEILLMDKIAKKLRKNRFEHGAINFEKIEVKFKMDEKGKPLGVFFKIAKDSNQLIEEYMLLANKKVAEFIGKPKNEKEKKSEDEKTFVYRIHNTPNPDKLNAFMTLITKLGYNFTNGNPVTVARSMNKLMKEVKEKPEANMVETLAIRTMSKASYSTENIGHYGLAFDYYTHFTSPIRRYPDVMVHRLLQQYLEQGK